MPGAIRDSERTEPETEDAVDLFKCTIALKSGQILTMVTDDMEEFETLDDDEYTFRAFKDGELKTCVIVPKENFLYAACDTIK